MERRNKDKKVDIWINESANQLGGQLVRHWPSEFELEHHAQLPIQSIAGSQGQLLRGPRNFL